MINENIQNTLRWKSIGNNETIPVVCNTFEIFAWYKNIPNSIAISNFGNIIHYPTMSKIIPIVSNNGRLKVIFQDGSMNLVDNMVAETFIYNDDPLNKFMLYHIDGNLFNNYFKNLMWDFYKPSNICPLENSANERELRFTLEAKIAITQLLALKRPPSVIAKLINLPILDRQMSKNFSRRLGKVIEGYDWPDVSPFYTQKDRIRKRYTIIEDEFIIKYLKENKNISNYNHLAELMNCENNDSFSSHIRHLKKKLNL